MKRSEAIKNLLSARTHADLAALYSSDMEVQVNVAQDGGERIDKDYKGKKYQSYSDGVDTWNHFRIPLNAKTEPEDNDHNIHYDLARHAEGIGMTGWDWRNKVSRWVAFDFDAVTGHSEKHKKKLSDSELKKIREQVAEIPWVTIRHSTGGKGLHLYVFLNNVPTATHTEHAALARAIIGLISSLTGTDIHASVDTCGGNMWVWHRKMLGTNGLTLIKQGEILEDVPPNWRDHLKVVSNQAKRTVPAFIGQESSEDVEKIFTELTNAKTRVPLDAGHQNLIKYLHETGAQAWWDQDNYCLVTHTIYLKEAHEKLNLKGVFKTISQGTDRGNDHNCFASPLRNGAWTVRRFTPGTAEESTWDIDPSGFTRCFYNREPDLQTAARSKNAVEHPTGGFVFREAEVAAAAAHELGVNIELPTWIRGRSTKLKQHKDGRLVVQIKHESNDLNTGMDGWLPEKGNWTRIFTMPGIAAPEVEIGSYDDSVRHLVTEGGDDCGWVLKTEREWRREPLVHIKTYLKSLNLKGNEVDTVIGSCIAKPWKLVCRPFEEEEPGNREWNLNAPQLAYIPSTADNLSYPTWLKVLNHLGHGLNDAVANDAWCKVNGVLTGADYLKCWIASVLQEPYEPLPYLFFYSQEQDTGKSSFQEAFQMLVTRGVERVDNALVNSQGFNGELENKILCVIEETDMRKDRTAYNRIKDWVTGRYISIHRKGQTPYSVLNTAHFVQTANEAPACPILPGDSRIVMIEVKAIDPLDMIPKKHLIPMLDKEAPDFLAAVLNLELPPTNDRLNIPVVETVAKKIAQKANQTYLELFLDEKCHCIPGKMVKMSDFYEIFKEWLDADQLRHWSKIRVGKELPKQFPKGRILRDNQVYIGNMSFEPKNPNEPILPTLVLSPSEHLVPGGTN